MLTPENAVLSAILLCLTGSVVTLLLARWRSLAGWVACGITAATALLVAHAVWQGLAGAGRPTEFPLVPSVGLSIRLHVDGLSGLFLLLAAVVALPAAFYSIAYLRHYEEYSVGRYYPHFLMFLAAMYGLLTTTDMMWFFFVFWQLMTLPGYALIRFEHRKPENRRAANKYLIVMQVACLATMLGAELVAAGGAAAAGGARLRYDFDTVSANLPALLAARPGTSVLAFALFLIGFGIKMGMWPFGQIWLPDAHPAAPSPVSAMLSGVMIKTGVYGLLRYFLWLVPADAQPAFPLAPWGLVVAVLGTLTLFTGTMQALKQEQSKRLLAFHSIGQIGYILLGTGACLALLPAAAAAGQAPVLAALGLYGALFHTLNHGVFKGLLFLNAGSMLHATGTQDLNRMGGLLKHMPWTALTALVASLSIAGVPLFNGFASKWSIYVATVRGSDAAPYLALCAVVAILTSALTLASFIKFFGVTFLGRTSDLVRGEAARRGALEVGWLMQGPQVFLAMLCLLLGLFPALGFDLLQAAVEASPHGAGTALARATPIGCGVVTGLAAAGATAVFAPLALALALGFLVLACRGLARLGGAPRRAVGPWLCGYAREAECNRYAAHHFYGEIKRPFRWFGKATPAAPVTPRKQE